MIGKDGWSIQMYQIGVDIGDVRSAEIPRSSATDGDLVRRTTTGVNTSSERSR
jgi:hypothetical protein